MEDLDIMELSGLVKSDKTYGKFYSENYTISGNPYGYDLERLVKDPQGNISNIIGLSKYYYHKNGIIMRVVNIIRDFGTATPNLDFPTKDKKVKKVIEDFNKRVGIRDVIKDTIFEISLTGNCAGYNRNGQRIDIYPISRINVTPLVVNNKPVLTYNVDELMEDYSLFGSSQVPEEVVNKLKMAYPEEVANAIATNKDMAVLNTDNTFFCKMNSSRYDAYGVTFLLPAFDELAHKNILKQAERSTANAIIEKILRISVGDKENKPTSAAVEYYDKLITGQKGSIKVTVPYFVNMDWIEPDSAIFGEEKFEQVDKDLLSALGVSLTLIRGEGGGNYSDGIINVAGLVKTIDNIRDAIIPAINDWYKQELIRNGIDPLKAPIVSFPKIDIDDSAKVELVQWLFQNAGLPYSVLYKETGYDFTSVKLQREEENESKIEDVFKLREQPFQGKGNNEGGRPEKSLTERTTDKSKSNNNQPRPSDK